MTEKMGTPPSAMQDREGSMHRERGNSEADAPVFKVFVGGISRNTDENEIFSSKSPRALLSRPG